MCGIVGLVRKPNRGKISSNREILKMMDRQKHRGPDDEGIVGFTRNESIIKDIPSDGIYACECEGLIGFNRLSIRDLSKAGHQPMISQDLQVAISFNGEIYNAEDIKKKVEVCGYKFKGTSDTEVILYAYMEFGIERLLQMLNGMYAIAIVDMKLRKLFLFRDRFGIKPLYYALTDASFAWASEIKSFLELPDFDRTLNLQSLCEHFTFLKPYDSVLFKSVKSIGPGICMIVDLDTFEMKMKKYFDVDDYNRPKTTVRSMEDYLEECEALLIDCIERQKVSDAKVGCQLSGGIDSSLITYYAAKKGENRLKDTISIIFDGEEKEYSEEPFVDFMLEQLNVEPHKKVIDEQYFINNLEKACYHVDSIIGRPNSIGLMLLSEHARKYVTVLLSGEGSDELSGGYAMFPKGELFARNNTSEEALAQYAVCIQQRTDKEIVQKLFPDYEGNKLIKGRMELFSSLHGSYFDKQIKYALKTYLLELLVCQDKVSMANSIENRVPFLDNAFVDFMFTVPKDYLIYISDTIKGLEDYRDISGEVTGKLLLKKLSERHFGYDFSFRRKMGFGIPYYRYFKRSKVFRDYYYDCILSGIKQRGILNTNAVEELYDKLGNSTYENNELFWKAINFEIWCQLFIDGRSYQYLGSDR